jgi:hypothetical protein
MQSPAKNRQDEMKSVFRKRFSQLLPAYLNGTLDPFGQLMVGLWLRSSVAARDELAQLGRIQKAVAIWEGRSVPEGVLGRIQQQIRYQTSSVTPMVKPGSERPLARRLAWVLVTALALFAVAIVWFALPPAISLKWSVSGGQPNEFRVYRAQVARDYEAASVDFMLLNTVPADQAVLSYMYSDLQILPGQRYLYRVDALDGSGVIVKSNTTLANSVAALPGQLLLIAALLLILYGLSAFIKHNQRPIRLDSGGQGMIL